MFNSIFILPKIISFEPTPELVIFLKSHYESENVKIIDIALGDKCGDIDFYVSEYSPTNSVLRPNYEEYLKYDKNLADTLHASNIVKVKMLPLDDWIAENMQGVVFDILKIDTQGFDYSVIKGGKRVIKNNVKVLIVEIQFGEYYHEYGKSFEIMQIMNQLDFELLNFVEINRRGIKMVECNAIFLNNKYYSSLKL